MDQFATTKIFGTHMVARLTMEREILRQFQRLPVLESSYVGLETMLGMDEDIDYEDFLNGMSVPHTHSSYHPITRISPLLSSCWICFNFSTSDPRTSEKMPGSVHDLMEAKMGIQIVRM